MAYRIFWTPIAVQDLHDICDFISRDNPVAAAIVDRAEALAGDRAGLAPAAAALSAAGCRYQWARTLVAIGGAERARGEAELAAMGATVMAWPPG